MLLFRALHCATLLIVSTAAFDHIALPRRYLNTTSSPSSSSLLTTPLPIPTPTSDEDSFITLWDIPSSSLTIAPSSGQISSAESSSNTSMFLGTIHTVVRPVIPSTTASCTPHAPGQPRIVYIILPNPSTVTQTLGANYTLPIKPKIPEFTPPTICPTTGSPFPEPPSPTGITSPPPIAPSTFLNPSSSHIPKIWSSAEPISTEIVTLFSPVIGTTVPGGTIFDGEDTTTIITTSKNPVTVYTTVSAPLYPDAGDAINKHTVDPALVGPNGDTNSFPTDSPRASGNPVGQIAGPVIITIEGHTIEIQPSYVVVGGSTHSYVDSVETGTSSVVAQSTNVIAGGITRSAAKSPEQTAGDRNSPKSTNVLVVDGGVLTAIGDSIVVFDGQTLEYGPSSTFTTDFHREIITLGASILFDGTTMGGAANSRTQLGIAGGISVTQVGQSVAIISSTSLTIGPQAVITTVYIDTYTIVANSGGLEVYGTTLSYPFNPVTSMMMFEGIAFTKIGSSIVVVSGSTYTIVEPTSHSKSVSSTSFSRQTISLESSGSPTISPDSASPAETSKKSDSIILKPVYILLGLCFWTSTYQLM